MHDPFTRKASLVLTVLTIAACLPVAASHAGGAKSSPPDRIAICHGFDCHFRSRYVVSASDRARFARILSAGMASPAAERAAISRAIMFFEQRATAAIGVADRAKSTPRQARRKGQMDCIDESTNSRALLLFLRHNGWLRHHDVLPTTSRGAFLDGRYPHATAVVKERASGRKWAIDSWYEPAGGPPDIMPLEEWRKRGVWGER